MADRDKPRIGSVVMLYPKETLHFDTVDELGEYIGLLLQARRATFPDSPSYYQNRKQRAKR